MTESDNPSQPADGNQIAYDGSQIQILEARESIRRRPGMYIGSIGEHGLHQLVYEVVGYAVDEHVAGHADAIDVTITADGGMRVADNGRGLPVEPEESTGRSAVELVLTELSFGSGPRSRHHVSGGLSGLGMCVVNALSDRLSVEVRRDGFRWTQEYERGVALAPLTRHEATTGHGTTIAFRPDAGIFETTRYSFATLTERLRELAFLNAGLAVSLTDERPERPERPVRFRHEDGLRKFVTHLNPYPVALVHSPAIGFASESGDGTVRAQVALQWNTGPRQEIRTFANSTRTLEGGAHAEGFLTSLTAVLNDHARRQRLLPADDGEPARELTAEEVRGGLVAVVSVTLADPVFEGSTRSRLRNAEAGDCVRDAVREHLDDWLERHPGEAAAIIRHIVNTATA